MKGILIKFKKDYENVDDFLESLFYKDKQLAELSYKFFKKLEQEKVLFSNKWKRHIIDIFECYPLKQEEKNKLATIFEKYSFIEKGRGKKPYVKLLEKNKKKEIDLESDEKIILEKIVKWNSSVSSYYSIINKLVGAGIIEKKNGEIRKSGEILNCIKKLRKIFLDNETSEKSYTYSPK